MSRDRSIQMAPNSLAPVPLPGECIYGFTSRFAAKWFRGRRSGAGLLVARNTAPTDRCLPRHIGDLTSHLPPQMALTPTEVMQKHSALPMFQPFLTEEEAAKATKAAIETGHLPFILGCAQSRIPALANLRLCVRCRADQIHECGMAYFHRELQVGCVLVCPKHHQPLCITDLAPNAVFGSQRFGTPDTSQTIACEYVPQRWLPHLIKISQDVSWLLQATASKPGPLKLHALYVSLLRSKGYLRRDGSIRLRSLREAFEDHFGADLLARLHCSVDAANRGGWLGRLTRRPRNIQQPVRHLLLLHFLGEDCQSALSKAESQIPVAALLVARPHAHRIRNPLRLARMLPAKRAEWLSALRRHRGGSLRERNTALYAWLWRNSPVWLRQHRPKAVNGTRHCAKRWHSRDRQIAGLIPNLACRLREHTSPSRRASRNAIASATGHASWLVYDHPWLPRSVAAIKRHAETSEQYALRRIRAAAAKLDCGVEAWELRVKAGVSASLTARSPAVSSALLHLSNQPRHGKSSTI